MPSVIIISVVDVLSGERYRFPVNSDCGFRVKHLRFELTSMIRRKAECRMLIFKDGLICDDEQLLLPAYFPNDCNVVEYYVVTQPKESAPAEKPPCVLDEVSLAAAQEWVTSHNSYLSNSEMQKKQYILQSIQKLTETESAEPSGEGGENTEGNVDPQAAGNNAEGGAGNGNEGNQVQWLNLRIIMRLVCGFLFFVQGSSSRRITMFLIASVVYYLIETGIALYLLNLLLGEQPPPEQPQQQQQQQQQRGQQEEQQGGQEPVGVGAVDGRQAEVVQDENDRGIRADPDRPQQQQQHQQQQQQQLPIQRQIARHVLEFAQSGAAIPPGRTGGIIVDILSTLASFCLSFIPEWSPTGINRR